MKTIEISVEMFDSLMEISNEIKKQDNRCTASPYYYQIQTDKEVATYGDNGDVIWVSDCDGDIVLRTDEEIKSCLLEAFMERDEFKDLDDEDALFEPTNRYNSMDDYDIENYLEDNGYSKYNVTTEHSYENVFFTEKACEQHIKTNKHNLNKPVSYINHAYRNPEMETVIKFLRDLSN